MRALVGFPIREAGKAGKIVGECGAIEVDCELGAELVGELAAVEAAELLLAVGAE